MMDHIMSKIITYNACLHVLSKDTTNDATACIQKHNEINFCTKTFQTKQTGVIVVYVI